MRKPLLLALGLCGVMAAFAGEIADFHRDHARPEEEDPAVSRPWGAKWTHGISEIGIEVKGGWSSMELTFIAKSDGTFRYHGKNDTSGAGQAKPLDHVGDFTGKVRQDTFQRLAQFIKDSDYMALGDSYTRPITDAGTVYTLVVMDGKKKTVSNYAEGGPMKLWAIQMLIMQLMETAEWDPPQSAPAAK